MFEEEPAFPGPLRLKVGIAAVHSSAHREICGADKVEEIELCDRPAKDGLSMPAAWRTPIQRDARLQELQLAIGARVAADREVRHFVVDAEIHPQRLRQRPSAVDPDFAAVLFHLCILDRKHDGSLVAASLDLEQLLVIVESIDGAFAPNLELKAGDVLLAPGHPAERLISLRFGELLG